MKPSAQAVLDFVRTRDFVTSIDVIRNVGTTCPHKRLSELYKAGLIDKDLSDFDGGFQMVYWAISEERLAERKVSPTLVLANGSTIELTGRGPALKGCTKVSP